MDEPLTYLVKAGHVRLARTGSLVLVMSLGTRWAYPAAMVLGLATTGVGLLVLTLVPLAVVGQAQWQVAAGFAGAFVLLGLSCIYLVRGTLRRGELPASSHTTVAIFDLAAGQLLDGAARPLAPLTEVEVGYRLVGPYSTNRRLMADWPGGSIELARESGFAPGFDVLAPALASAGVPVKARRPR